MVLSELKESSRLLDVEWLWEISVEEAGHKVRLADIEDSERPGFIGEGTADILCYRIWIVWCLRRPFGKLSWNTMWWPYCRGHGGFCLAQWVFGIRKSPLLSLVSLLLSGAAEKAFRKSLIRL